MLQVAVRVGKRSLGSTNISLHRRASTNTHVYPSVLQALVGRGYSGCLEWVILGVSGRAMQDLGYELPRILIPRTPVNKPPSAMRQPPPDGIMNAVANPLAKNAGWQGG